jgi:hypothetical protein
VLEHCCPQASFWKEKWPSLQKSWRPLVYRIISLQKLLSASDTIPHTTAHNTKHAVHCCTPHQAAMNSTKTNQAFFQFADNVWESHRSWRVRSNLRYTYPGAVTQEKVRQPTRSSRAQLLYGHYSNAFLEEGDESVRSHHGRGQARTLPSLTWRLNKHTSFCAVKCVWSLLALLKSISNCWRN